MNKNKFNILHIIPLLGCGGAEVLLGNIVNKQIELGYKVIICCLYPFHSSFDNYPNKDFLIDNGLIKFINTRVVFSLKGKTKIIGNDYIKLLNDFKPNVIHSHLFEAELIAMSHLLPEVKYVSHIHDNIIQFKKFNKKDLINKNRISTLKERAWLINKYLKVKPVFLCISNDVMRFVEQNLPKKFSSNLLLLHNAIDLKRFVPSYDRGFTYLHIVSVGNLVEKKNHMLLLEIALILRQKIGPHFKIDILGFGPLYEGLNQRIKLENLEKNVFLRGSVGNVEEYYKKANVYVHTATYEPFGLVLIEAMASGLPVITLDGIGNRDIINEGINGFLINENDANIFVEKILSIFQNRNYLTRLSVNAISYSANFGMDNYINKLHKYYTL